MSRLALARRALVGLTCTLLAVPAVAACSSGSSASSDAAATPAATATSTGRLPGAGQRQPGVSGLVAAVSGSSMQVQSQTKQTAVSWTATTTFTKAQRGSIADLSVGACVAARSANSGESLAASTVQVTTPAADGSCAAGFGGGGFGGGAAPGGMPSAPGNDAPRPADMPTGPPPGGGQAGTGAPGGAGGFAFGKVTSVSGSTFTVERTGLPDQTAGSTEPVTVTTTADTAYTTVVPATSGDVAVGQCATAQGQTSDTGAVTATSVALRASTNGSCFGAPGNTGG